MKTDIFLIVSTVILAVLLLLRCYSVGYINLFRVDTNKNVETAVIEQSEIQVELSNISIAIEAEESFKEFELIGISIVMPDSGYYFEPIHYTPKAGVRISTDKCFTFPPKDWNKISEAIIAIIGKYKGKTIHSPALLKDIINPYENRMKHALSIELRNISENTFDTHITCI